MEGEEQYVFVAAGDLTRGWRSPGVALGEWYCCCWLSLALEHISRSADGIFFPDFRISIPVKSKSWRILGPAAFITGKHHSKGKRRTLFWM